VNGSLLSLGSLANPRENIVMGRQQEAETLTLDLTAIRQLATDIARDEDPTLMVLAATNAEGATDYTEVIMARDRGVADLDRIVIGLSRNDGENDIRERLRDRLREHLTKQR
jgi:hypothetical protein